MRRLALATVAVAGLSATAYALPSIPSGSTLNVVGSSNFDATTITVTNPAALLTGAGAFTALGTCVSCVVVVGSPYTYSPFTPGVILTAVNNGDTATVDLTGQESVTYSPLTLAIVDDATLSLTGYADTAGIFIWTLNQTSGSIIGSFSATATAVPEPASLGLLGLGLLGLGMVRRRC